MTEESSGPSRAHTAPQRLGVGSILLLGALIYMIGVGGTGGGELSPVLRLLTAVIAGGVLAAGVVMARRFTDRLDRAVAMAVALFALAGVVSEFPRQSFDATLTAAAYGAGFLVARGVLANPRARAMLEQVLIGLSIFFTLAAVLSWVPDIVLLWSLSGWEVFPALDLPLLSGGWGYRYDVALLILVLYPAWWAGRPSRMRRVVAVPFGVLTLAALVITGSRALWLATAMASVVLGAPMLIRLWRVHRWARFAIGTAAAAGVIAAFVISEPLISRLLTGTTLEYRFAQWGPLTDLWLRHPLAGVGPGSFPWALQLTPYFDTNSWAPRHPDNALFQLLPEAGVLGLVAVLLVAAALIPAVWRGPSLGARWALITCAVVSIGSNPTEVAFLVVPMVAWAAYGAPRAVAAHRPEPAAEVRAPLRTPVRLASGVALAIIGLVQASTLLATLSYESARASAGSGDARASIDELSKAIAFDPGMALYWRQRGIGWLVLGDPTRAAEDLAAATEINPADGLTWRAKALAHDAAGDAAAAQASIESALRVQRSDAASILVAAELQSARGAGERSALLAELVQAWPAVVGARGWAGMVADGETPQLIAAARQRWETEQPSLIPLLHQDLWLTALTGAEQSPTSVHTSPALADAFVASLRCSEATPRLLDQLTPSDRRTGMYWVIRARDAANRGAVDADAIEALRIHTGDAPISGADARLNPLNEGVWWGYRRYPIFWPSTDMDLPDPGAGLTRWTHDPAAAVAEAGLEAQLPECVNAGG